VNDLLDLSKIEAGRMPFVAVPREVASLLDDAARGMQGLAATRGTRLACPVADRVLEVVGDRDQLQRVVVNLLSNAIKYSPPGSLVTLSGRATSEGIEVTIDDEGPGILVDQLDRLFRPFSRVGAHERQTTGGTGLGLAISRAIVEQHGGRIWVEARQPHGCRFAFTLPAGERPHEPIELSDVA
jgi:signal transduction histidine kinase